MTVSLVLLSNLAVFRILGKFILVRYASDNMGSLLSKFPEMADSPDLFGSVDDERDPGGGSPSLSDAEMPDSQRSQRIVSGAGAGPGGDVFEDDSDQQNQPHSVLTNYTMKRKFSYWRLTLTWVNLHAVFRADNSLFLKHTLSNCWGLKYFVMFMSRTHFFLNRLFIYSDNLTCVFIKQIILWHWRDDLYHRVTVRRVTGGALWPYKPLASGALGACLPESASTVLFFIFGILLNIEAASGRHSPWATPIPLCHALTCLRSFPTTLAHRIPPSYKG